LNESRQETGHTFPSFLPDGRHFLYFARSVKPENNAVFVGSLDSTEAKFLFRANSGAIYAPPAYLLFLRAEILTAQPFDADRLELSGEPFPVAKVAGTDASIGLPTIGSPAFSTSESGVLAYRNTGRDMQLVWLDREGKQLGSVGPPGEYLNVALSQGERRVVIDRYDSSHGLYRKAASGAGQEERLVETSEITYTTDWSSDGRFILYQTGLGASADLWVLPLFGDPSTSSGQGRKPIPFSQTEFGEQEGRFSPNGRWIAYHSNESGRGRNEVYVQSFPASAGKWQISTDGGYVPKWSRDGKELFYIAADGKFMSVPVNAGATFEAGVPKALFQTWLGVPVGGGYNHYDVSADSQRFLMNVPVGEGNRSPITVVVNWPAGVNR
jgi:hypothetical protein